MPTCASCDRYLAPNTVQADGSCPTCGAQVDFAAEVQAVSKRARVPWHFWLIVALATGYLTWRLIQGAWWLIT